MKWKVHWEGMGNSKKTILSKSQPIKFKDEKNDFINIRTKAEKNQYYKI